MSTLHSEPPSTAQVVARRWRRARSLVFAALALVTLVIILAELRPAVRPQYLDPQSPSRGGARALAQILAQRGIAVRVSRDASDAAFQMHAHPGRATLVVVRSERLTSARLDELRNVPGDLLLVEPDDRTLDLLAPGVRRATRSTAAFAEPGCELTDAALAGRVGFQWSYTYEAPQNATKCYPAAEGLPRLVRLPVFGRTVTVLGSGRPLSNEYLAQDGNAALGINLAGTHPTVVWLIPDPPPANTAGQDGNRADGTGEDGTGKSLTELMPFGVKLAALQLVVAVVLTALWRSRRLGPVVAEPLPVVVRSAEAVEGRARLYRAQHARDRAADALRAGARERLVPLLGLPRGSAQDPRAAKEIVTALADRVSWDAKTIDTALYGPAPEDDAALIGLTDFLDDLERQVRQS